MDIKLIALDVDGTLVNEARQVAVATEQAVARAVAAGYQVVLATGRSYVELVELLPQLPGVRYGVTCDGGSVMDLQTGQLLFAGATIPLPAVQEIYSLVKDDRNMVEVYSGGAIYNPQDRLECQKDYIDVEPVPEGTRTPVADMTTFLAARAVPVEKVHIFYKTIEGRDLCIEKLSHLPVDFAPAAEVDVNITPKNKSKGVSLAQLAKRLDIDCQEILAIGDSFNDVGMLKLAGVSIAMGNALPGVQEYVGYITDTNGRDGVAKALHAFLDNNLSSLAKS